MRLAMLWLLQIATVAYSIPTRAAIDDPVRISGGLISGVAGAANEVRVFKGIPYAAAPMGELRWRAPQPVPPWSGVRKADTFSNNCTQLPHAPGSYYQVEYYPEAAPSGEDCLYLNVWTAAQTPNERRPVIVWIHG